MVKPWCTETAVRGSNSTGGIFRTRPDRYWGPPTLIQDVPSLFPGGWGVALTTHHPAPRLKNEYGNTSTPPLDLRGMLQGEIYLQPFKYEAQTALFKGLVRTAQ